MNTVFLDTVGLVANWDTDDQWHTAAEGAYRRLIERRRTLVTTSFVLLKCGNTSARRSFRGDVCVLRRALELRNELILPSEDDWRRAWAAFERGEAGQAAIVDQISFQVMRRLGITEAFTNDKHFQAAGFTVLF